MVAFFIIFSLVVCAQLTSLSAEESFRADPIHDDKLLKVSRVLSSFCCQFMFVCLTRWRLGGHIRLRDITTLPCWSLTIWHIQLSALQITTITTESVRLRVNSHLADVESRSDVSISEALLAEFDRTKITNTVTMLSSGRCFSSFDW